MTALALAVRFLHLAACVGVVGIAAMLLIAGRSDHPTALGWHAGMVRAARRLVLVALAAGIATLAVQAAILEARASAAFEPDALRRAVLETQVGTIWLVRISLLVLLGAFLVLRDLAERGIDWIAARGETALLGIAALGLLGAAGHAAAVEPGTATAIAVDAIHLVAAGVWAGALPALAALLAAAGSETGADARPYAVVAARRFSRVALGAMAVLVLSGVLNATTHVGGVAALLGTPYGWVLLAKLGLLVPILVLAARNRARWLPALGGDSATVGRAAMRGLRRSVSAEAALVLAVLLLAAGLTLVPPARHVDAAWPFPFRLSTTALTHRPELGPLVLIGSQVALLGVVATLAAALLRGRRLPALGGALVLLVTGGVIAVPPLVIDAYPTTYVRPAAPYTAASIAAGAELYASHCATCHGARGAGDGPAARGLPRPPADLRAPHTSDHTAGDIFWWITQGIPRGAMPGFGDRLSEDERWDLVNFVRVLGASAAARRLGPTVEPERPWLVAPDFAFAVGPTPSRTLRDFRGRRVVLLALYSLPGSRARLARIAERYDALTALGTEVIAVPTDAAPDAIARLGPEPPIFFPIVTDGAADIVRAYTPFAVDAAHAEFLIDRQGYLRARLPGAATGDVDALLAEIQQLNAEKTVPPPPAEHVH